MRISFPFTSMLGDMGMLSENYAKYYCVFSAKPREIPTMLKELSFYFTAIILCGTVGDMDRGEGGRIL